MTLRSAVPESDKAVESVLGCASLPPGRGKGKRTPFKLPYLTARYCNRLCFYIFSVAYLLRAIGRDRIDGARADGGVYFCVRDGHQGEDEDAEEASGAARHRLRAGKLSRGSAYNINTAYPPERFTP